MPDLADLAPVPAGTPYSLTLSSAISAALAEDATVTQAAADAAAARIAAEDLVTGAEQTAALATKLDTAVASGTYVPGVIAVGDGIDPTGVTDSSTALQAKIDETADGAALYIPAGRYKASGLTVTGKSITIHARGAVFEQASNTNVLTFTGAHGTITAVSAITVESVLLGDGLTTKIARLTLADSGHGLAAGDVVKIASDDTLPSARSAERRTGEYAQVASVAGAEVTLTGTLRESYTLATTRVAKLERHRLVLDGFECTSPASADAAGWNVGALVVQGAYNPTLRGIVGRDMHGPLLSMLGCWQPLVDDLVAENLTNDPSLTRYGYGINDQACEGGTYSNLRGVNVRHLFTTNTASVAAGTTQLYRHGRSAHLTVAHGHSIGSSNTAFDTHEESYDVTFIECVAVGSYQGNSASGSGFVARGKRLAFHHCRAYRCRNGFTIQEQYVGSTEDVLLDECETWGVTEVAINVTTSDATMRCNAVRINGGTYDADRWTLYATRGDIIQTGRTKMISRYDAGAYSGPIRLEDVDLRFAHIDIDLSGATEPSNVRVVKVQDTLTKFIGDRLDMTIGAAGVSHWFAFDGGTDVTGRLKVKDLRADVKKSVTNGLTGTDIGWRADDVSTYSTLTPEYLASGLVTAYQNPVAQSGWATPPATFQATDYLGLRYSSDGVQGSYIEWDINLAAGTWAASLFCRTGTDQGQLTLSFDGVDKGYFETYESGAQSRRRELSAATFTLTESRRYRVRLTAAAKHSSSTSYFGRINALSLVKSA